MKPQTGLPPRRQTLLIIICMQDKENAQPSIPVERHPLAPFLPPNAKVLMLGSFPPLEKRWSMPFFYPNFINDMWRIMGQVFYADKDRFVDADGKRFRMPEIVRFATETGLAFFDTAQAVRRLKDNASDKFLEIVEPTDVAALIDNLPQCRAIVTTGQKACEALAATFNASAPAVGNYVKVSSRGRELRFYRMPSSSRAYPLPLAQKAAHYAEMFRQLGML